MNIYDKIEQGQYKAKSDNPPDHPRRPTTLSKPSYQLTDDEIRQLPKIKAEYEADQAAWNSYWAERRTVQHALDQQFYLDLCEENAVPHDHPFIEKLYSQAWEHGHSSGHNDVALHFEESLDLWQEALKMKDTPSDDNATLIVNATYLTKHHPIPNLHVPVKLTGKTKTIQKLPHSEIEINGETYWVESQYLEDTQ